MFVSSFLEQYGRSGVSFALNETIGKIRFMGGHGAVLPLFTCPAIA
jgi:hypothetical protein